MLISNKRLNEAIKTFVRSEAAHVGFERSASICIMP